MQPLKGAKFFSLYRIDVLVSTFAPFISYFIADATRLANRFGFPVPGMVQIVTHCEFVWVSSSREIG
jgi:hypothetical protein